MEVAVVATQKKPQKLKAANRDLEALGKETDPNCTSTTPTMTKNLSKRKRNPG